MRETRGEYQRLVNSSILHWQCSLHLVGVWLATSTVIGRWDEDAEAEDAALAVLAALRCPRSRERDHSRSSKVTILGDPPMQIHL